MESLLISLHTIPLLGSHLTIGLPTSFTISPGHAVSLSIVSMSSERMFRARLTVLFFTLLSLAVTALNSAIARFAVVLRDRARSDNVDPVDRMSDGHFQSLQSKILNNTVPAAVAIGALTIYGVAIAVHPRWLRDHESILPRLAISYIILAFVMMVTGAYVADQVHGLQTSFENFAFRDQIPYYSLMYYGGIAQAAYGSVLIFLTIMVVVAAFASDYCKRRIHADAAVPEEE
jgi:hypothetical protein